MVFLGVIQGAFMSQLSKKFKNPRGHLVIATKSNEQRQAMGARYRKKPGQSKTPSKKATKGTYEAGGPVRADSARALAQPLGRKAPQDQLAPRLKLGQTPRTPPACSRPIQVAAGVRVGSACQMLSPGGVLSPGGFLSPRGVLTPGGFLSPGVGLTPPRPGGGAGGSARPDLATPPRTEPAVKRSPGTGPQPTQSSPAKASDCHASTPPKVGPSIKTGRIST